MAVVVVMVVVVVLVGMVGMGVSCAQEVAIVRRLVVQWIAVDLTRGQGCWLLQRRWGTGHGVVC